MMPVHCKKRQELLEARMLKRVEISEKELFWLKVNRAKDFLREHYSEEYAVAYESTPQFWIWWTQLWCNFDEELLRKLDRMTLDFLVPRDDYRDLFNDWAGRYRPNGIIARYMHQRLEAIREEQEQSLVNEALSILKAEVRK